MKQIASFTVNHDVLKKGFYISRIDGDIATYDIRMAIPNSGPCPIRSLRLRHGSTRALTA